MVGLRTVKLPPTTANREIGVPRKPGWRKGAVDVVGLQELPRSRRNNRTKEKCARNFKFRFFAMYVLTRVSGDATVGLRLRLLY